MRGASPLRYPGGKWRLARFFEHLIERNFSTPPRYIEAYAGSCSLGLSLLFSGAVKSVVLNDRDPAIYACWDAMLNHTKRLVKAIDQADVSPGTWEKQRRVYAEGRSAATTDRFKLGFATFFLNRTNHSGVLSGGMIGGKAQRGPWKIDARFNKHALIQRVERIAQHRSKISLSQTDALQIVCSQGPSTDDLLFLDPPYEESAQRRNLYLSTYRTKDHQRLRDAVARLRSPWVVSYDNSSIIRELYGAFRRRNLRFLYSARNRTIGREVLYFSGDLRIPRLSPLPSSRR